MEIMLVLVIAVTLLLMSVRYYYRYQRDIQITQFEREASAILQGLNMYYYGHCHDTTVTDVTINDLFTQGYIARMPINPWGDFAVKIDNVSQDSTQPFYRLQLLASLQKVKDPLQRQSLANLLRGSLNADMSTTSLLMWTYLPQHTLDALHSWQWLMVHGNGQDILPGRNVSAVNSAMNSKLWIMDGSRDMFIQQEKLSREQYPQFSDAACPN